MSDIVFLNSQGAFNRAIASGRLSCRKGSDNYAGDYMYMGTFDGADQFKNINTREYLGRQNCQRDRNGADHLLNVSIGGGCDQVGSH